MRVFTLLLLLCSCSSWAQERPTAADFSALFRQPAPEAELQALQQQLHLADSCRGDFQQIRWLKVLQQPLNSSGHFIFAPQDGMVWQQLQPFASTLVLSQQQLIQTDSAGNVTVQQANQAPSELVSLLPRLLQALLSGDTTFLRQHFQLFLSRQGTQWQLGLLSRDPQLTALLPQLVLEGQQHPSRIVLLSTQGDISEIRLQQLVVGALTPAEQALLEAEVSH